MAFVGASLALEFGSVPGRPPSIGAAGSAGSRIVGAAGRGVDWAPTPGGVVRTEGEVAEVLAKHGIELPDYVRVRVADDLVPEGADAVYLQPQQYREAAWTWDDLVHPKTGQVAVKISQ